MFIVNRVANPLKERRWEHEIAKIYSKFLYEQI
nr:MAG TPA: hypothetical protein [Caudoviricetes sp.]